MPKPTAPGVPALLKQWRERRRCTQIAGAELLGVPVGTLRDWEQGRSQPRGLALRTLLAEITPPRARPH